MHTSGTPWPIVNTVSASQVDRFRPTSPMMITRNPVAGVDVLRRARDRAVFRAGVSRQEAGGIFFSDPSVLGSSLPSASNHEDPQKTKTGKKSSCQGDCRFRADRGKIRPCGGSEEAKTLSREGSLTAARNLWQQQ